MPFTIVPITAATPNVPQSNMGLVLDPRSVEEQFNNQITKIAFAAGTYIILNSPGAKLSHLILCPGSTSGLTVYDDNAVPTAGHELLFCSAFGPVGPQFVPYKFTLARGIVIVTTGGVNFDNFTAVYGT